MRRAYERDDKDLVYLTRDEFWSDRPCQFESLGCKVRIAGPSDPISHDAISIELPKKQQRAIDLRIAQMEGGAKAVAELRKQWRQEYLEQWCKNVDEVMRLRRERRAKRPGNKLSGKKSI
jgi:hypothetical protein